SLLRRVATEFSWGVRSSNLRPSGVVVKNFMRARSRVKRVPWGPGGVTPSGARGGAPEAEALPLSKRSFNTLKTKYLLWVSRTNAHPPQHSCSGAAYATHHCLL